MFSPCCPAITHRCRCTDTAVQPVMYMCKLLYMQKHLQRMMIMGLGVVCVNFCLKKYFNTADYVDYGHVCIVRQASKHTIVKSSSVS